MTFWRNESQDIVKIEFDVGKGFRELITLGPQAEIELPDRLDKYVPLEAPQLKVITTRREVHVQAMVFEQPKKKSVRKPKDTNGIQ